MLFNNRNKKNTDIMKKNKKKSDPKSITKKQQKKKFKEQVKNFSKIVDDFADRLNLFNPMKTKISRRVYPNKQDFHIYVYNRPGAIEEFLGIKDPKFVRINFLENEKIDIIYCFKNKNNGLVYSMDSLVNNLFFNNKIKEIGVKNKKEISVDELKNEINIIQEYIFSNIIPIKEEALNFWE